MNELNPVRERRADVYKGDHLAGLLVRDADDVIFRYTDDYFSSDLPAIATTIPKTKTEVRARGGAVPAFFAGLLPEGRRLVALQRTLKTSSDDEFSQLLAIGRDCIGDVRVLPEGSDGSDLPSFEPAIGPPAEISFSELFERAIGDGSSNTAPSIPGVQDKLSDAMLSLPIRQRGGAVILKLGPAAYPRLVENEAFFLRMAKSCGIRVPKFEIIHDKDGQSGLLIERFDRQISRGRQIRVAQEDAVQLAGRWPSAKYQMTSKDVFDAVLRVTPAAPVARAHLLRLFVYCYMIANGDLHAKNVSVYNHPEGTWSLTPGYDLVSTLPYGDSRMAIQLDGRDARLTGSVFISFAQRIGMTERLARGIIDEVTAGGELLTSKLSDIGLDAKKSEHLQLTITNRIAELRK